MTAMTEPLLLSEGMAVVHLFGKLTPSFDRGALAAAVDKLVGEAGLVIPVAVVGHKADLAVMALHRDLTMLRRLQSEMRRAGVDVIDSYVSLTEFSEYAEAARISPEMRDLRLYPKVLPPEGMRAWCFYPMTKRRAVGANWFREPFERRRAMMEEHGKSGRTFAGRISQLVTGSTGLDDYEWGVTLFAVHPDDLKDVVYTMRFDEASAIYGEFGRFYVGTSGSLDDVLELLGA